MVHIAFFQSPSQKDDIHPSHKAQIAILIVNKASILIFTKHFDFANVFSSKLALKLPEHNKINDCTIKLLND